VRNDAGIESRHPGEFVITETGVEGGVIYTVSATLRDEILATGMAMLRIDLAPDRDVQHVARDLWKARGKRSMATHLQRHAHIEGVKAGLLREVVPKEDFTNQARLAAAIKSLPLRLVAPRPLKEAISTAGGVGFDSLDERLMSVALPGLFCAGEMLDWEAPTGGYLLTACLASGWVAGSGAARFIAQRQQVR
jgi:predicted flavoprotein YhiN